MNWLILAGAVLIIAAISYFFLRDKPADLGLQPLGSEGKVLTPVLQEHTAIQSIYKNKVLYLLGSSYFLFGYT